MKGKRKEQVDAANKMLADTAAAEVTAPINNPVAPPDGGPLPGEAVDPESLLRPVPPERLKVGAWQFKQLVQGEPFLFTVDRIVSEEEAEASPDDKPLFHGVYVKEYPSGHGYILNAHFQLVAFLEDEVAEGRHRTQFYEAVMTGERPLKGGRTVCDYRFREGKLPS